MSHSQSLADNRVVCLGHIVTGTSAVARLPALINAYSALDGRDYPTIQNIARTIREAGFIPTTKRGSGASIMSEREVVNLILGANGAESALESPNAVERLRKLQRAPWVEVPGANVPLEFLDETDPHSRGYRMALEAQQVLEQTIWAPLLKIENFGEACEWLVRNASLIDAEMTKLRLAAYRAHFEANPRLLGEEETAKLALGQFPDWVLEASARWSAPENKSFKLTIARHEATFEAVRPLKGFTGIRLKYCDDSDEAKWDFRVRNRRTLVEVDFAIIRELARLVASKPEAK